MQLTTLETNPRQIRKANPNDIAEIVEVEKKCFPGPTAYTKSQLAYLVLKANSTSLVEYDSGRLSGFVIILYRKVSQIAGIETIDVDPAYKNRGVGQRLLQAAEDDMKRRGVCFSQLEVSEGNKAAIGLYQKAGYQQKEKLCNYYVFEHNGTRDAVRMIKALAP